MKRATVLMVVVCLLALAADAAAVAPQTAASHKPQATSYGTEAITIPQMLSYQGKLTDTLGVPVGDTLYAVRFRLYAVPSGGTQFWEETQDVRTEGGLFSVLLGAVTPIGSLPDAGTVYLAMSVSGGPELTPRIRIASAAYSYLAARAADADLLQGEDTTGFVRTGQVNSVTSAMLVDGTVASADIADTNVTMAKIARAGASTGQVVKWTGSAWAPGPDNTGGGSGVTNVYQDTGIICVPNPITSSGNVKLDLSYGDGRYVNVTGDSLTGALAVQGDLRVYGKGRIGTGNSNAGKAAFAAGEGNTASANYSSVSGGADNTSSGLYAHIGGGGENRVAGDYASVGGGVTNYASGARSSVSGGSDNEAYGLYGAIGGGLLNTAGAAAADTCATVAGGKGNLATAMFATVGGGQNDTASGSHSTVGGGYGNKADTSYATVGGGYRNDATGYAATVAGGYDNAADTTYATIGGGYSNLATNYGATVGGGTQNYAKGNSATVGGGFNNRAETSAATVGGGRDNIATGHAATVGGGDDNRAFGYRATVGGGWDNAADTSYATVGGGSTNHATGYGATVGGGLYNYATGYGATVPGGNYCAARGTYSLAAGVRAKANHNGSFAWSDSAASASESVYTTGNNQFRARARGGTWFFSNAGMTTGAYLASGSNSWESACDSMTKEDFRAVDRKALLDKVAALRVRDYKMKDQNDGTRHIGPVAQDFHSAFGYGGNETSINLADADGVLLAAVQALYDEMKVRDKAQQMRIAQLEAELAQTKKH
ncbi:hypothetical protein FJY68_08465 [candidate division WOR-3 bacterium]|uniref:Peptidase S74 domain-containing protein n=1 Tax=candidate division WOR-3 bacterium TaxID=2052148 RepID=A0A937XEZ6_UNCW3|nr:hypothetical protein [candidate division WOR-3 bacterium]